MDENLQKPELSVIIPVCGRHAPPEDLYAEYNSSLVALDRNCQLIFVLDGPHERFAEGLRTLLDRGERFTVIGLSRPFGEATALMVGFEHAAADVILTLPAYFQVNTGDIGKLLKELSSADVVIGRRWPRAGGWIERARRTAFHGLLRWVTRLRFNDLGCGARALKRRVLEEIQLYGDQHRFLAVLADRQGFRVREVQLRQSEKDQYPGTYTPREYARGFLDIFTVFFLVRFTKRPLRFFGMAGVSTFAIGAVAVLILVIDRLLFDHGLTERPALLLASLLVVLGTQLFALGLLGELMIFTHARTIKDYQVDRIIKFSRHTDAPQSDPDSAEGLDR